MDRAALLSALSGNAAAVRLREVDIPGLGRMFIRAATIGDTEAEFAIQGDAKGHVLSRRLARMLCDEHGQPLLDASNPSDLELLRAQPEAVLMQLSRAAAELDGTTTDAREALGNG